MTLRFLLFYLILNIKSKKVFKYNSKRFQILVRILEAPLSIMNQKLDTELMENIFFILFLLIVGYALKFAKTSDNFAISLNAFIIYISLPATILLQIPKVKLDSTILLPLVVSWLVLLFSVIFIMIFARDLDKKTKAALLLIIPLGNTSFFGFPMIESLLGSEALSYAAIFDQFGSFMILATYGTFIVSFYQGDSVGVRKMLDKLIFFPPFGFLLFALIFGESPAVVQPYIKILANTLTPLAIISVGYSMQLDLGNEKMIFAKAITLKLVIIPLVVLIFFRLFGATSLSANVTLLEVAMPPMITAAAIAINAGFAPRLSASLVGYGILISMITIPIFNMLFKWYP